jgi:hypothetical protein
MILALFEGKTEENTLNGLKIRKYIEFDFLKNTKGSSVGFRKAVVDILSVYLKKGEPLGVVMVCDLDRGKTVEDVRKSIEDAVNETLDVAKIEKSIRLVHKESNIFFAENVDPTFVVVLHIAQKRCIEGIPPFKNCTTDDYVLDLALRKETIKNLPEFRKAQEKNPDLIPEDIQNKIKSEIFGMLKDNGIELGEAKGFVNLYIAVLQLGGEGSIPYSGLPGKVIAHARQEDVEEVFKSWITAFRMVGEVIHGT